MKKQDRKARWGQIVRLSRPLMFCLFLESEKHDLLLCRFRRKRPKSLHISIDVQEMVEKKGSDPKAPDGHWACGRGGSRRN